MNTAEWFFEIADADFSGNCFNAPSLMTTLEAMSAQTAATPGTHEGYSAWDIALHLAYYKYFVCHSLENAKMTAGIPVPPFPYKLDAFPPLPGAADRVEWKACLQYLRTIHAVSMRILRALPVDRLDEIMTEWQIPFGQAVAWLCGHDSYHNAQIRNMGVPGLREMKKQE